MSYQGGQGVGGSVIDGVEGWDDWIRMGGRRGSLGIGLVGIGVWRLENWEVGCRCIIRQTNLKMVHVLFILLHVPLPSVRNLYNQTR